MRSLVVGLLAMLAAGTAGAEDTPWTVQVTNLGWHTGIAVRTAEIDPAIVPEIGDFDGALWIEFGWGDRDFYRDSEPAIATYFSAAFEDTPAVMHLVAMGAHPRAFFRDDVEILPVPLSEAEHRRLLRYLADSFDRGDRPRAASIGNGLYGVSLFYDAHGRFNLSNTCNTWVARAFAAAGLPIDPDLRRASTVVQRLKEAVAAR